MKENNSLFAFLVLAFCIGINAFPQEDLVESLPGYDVCLLILN